jgi:hypothetical protein
LPPEYNKDRYFYSFSLLVKELSGQDTGFIYNGPKGIFDVFIKDNKKLIGKGSWVVFRNKAVEKYSQTAFIKRFARMTDPLTVPGPEQTTAEEGR